MKYNKSFLVFVLLILSSTATIAQAFPVVYNKNTFTLRSDLPSKSVLVSNLFSDKVADMSPFIGAALWTDSGRLFQCRSLLEFNYHFLPSAIVNDPLLIESALLILFPVEPVPAPNVKNKPYKFIIQRVSDKWVDTATMWINQPAADLSMEVVEIIKKKQKNNQLSIDVTKMVKEMLHLGNNGFLFSFNQSAEQTTVPGQWFASPKNDDINLRPLLIINYKVINPFESLDNYYLLVNEKQRQMNMIKQMQQATFNPPEIIITKEPVKVIPVKN